MATADYADLIQQVAISYDLDGKLLTAQVEVESGGDPNAFRYEPDFYRQYIRLNVNAKAGRYGPFAACSVGLLQIMVEVAYELGFDGRPEELFAARVGLSWGAKNLKSLLDWAGGNYDAALASYNGGRRGNATPPLRNQAYVDRVRAVVTA